MQNARVFLLLVTCFISMGQKVFALADTASVSNSTAPLWTRARLIAAVVLALLIIAIVIVRSLMRKPRLAPPLTQQPGVEELRRSVFVPSVQHAILSNFRRLKFDGFYTALILIANCPIYSDQVIAELTKIISKQPPYDNLEWLDDRARCRSCRFLHLALERNRAARSRDERFDNGVEFNAIYYASTTDRCVIGGETKGFARRLAAELKGILKELIG